jgi:hypothetical protein
MITAAQYYWNAKYLEDMDEMRCGNPECTDCAEALHLHSGCAHGDRHLDIGCYHPNHVLTLGCDRCRRVIWCWHLDEHGEHHHDEEGKPGSQPCTWGWSDWDAISEGHEYTRLPMCHPNPEITHVKARGEVQVRCTLGYKHGSGNLRHAIRSRASEVVQ